MNANQTALDAYLARTAAIHAKLERLQQLADDHFGYEPMPSIGATSTTSGGVFDIPACLSELVVNQL